MSDLEKKDISSFFTNNDFVELIDFMARRYGKLPHEIVMDVSINDYNFDMAVMLKALDIEHDRIPKKKTEKKTFKDFGLKHVVKKQ